MSLSRTSTAPRFAGALLAAAATLHGCSESSSGFGSESEPLYGISSMIFSTDGQTTYVPLLSDFEKGPNVALADAREFPGYSPVDAVDGVLYVGSGESPSVTRLRVSDDHEWLEEGVVGFGAFASASLSASIYVDGERAYMPVAPMRYVAWDPSALSILDEIETPASLPATRDELRGAAGYDHERSGRYIYQPFYYSSADFHQYTEVSPIAVFDTETDTIVEVIEAPCPHLHITSQDSAGNVYFSNGQGSIAAAVLDATQPRNCVVRVLAGETQLDETFSVNFADLTEGREGSNFFVINDEVAIINVYHAERDTITEETTFGEVDYSSNYHLWKVDLQTMEASMIDGVDYGGGQIVAFDIDGRTLLTVPAADYSSTAVFEVAADAKVTKLFDVEGWAFKLFRIR